MDTVTMLIAGDVDAESVTRLLMVLKRLSVDLVLAGGPFPPAPLVHGARGVERLSGASCSVDTLEVLSSPKDQQQQRGVAGEGDMTSILALLENIVCRVCYVPGHADAASTLRLSDAPHPRLTPNSVNIHDRLLQLLPGLCLTGYTETGSTLSSYPCLSPQREVPSLTSPGQETVNALRRTLSARTLCEGCSVVMAAYRPSLLCSPPIEAACQDSDDRKAMAVRVDTECLASPPEPPCMSPAGGSDSFFSAVTSEPSVSPSPGWHQLKDDMLEHVKVRTDEAGQGRVDDVMVVSGGSEEGQEEGAEGWRPSEELLPSTLRAYLGSSDCQRNLLMHVCVSDHAGTHGLPGAVSSVGKVVVLRPGSLRHGHFATVQLSRAPTRACGWTVAETRLHRLP